jgi:hypothetical protein
MIPLSGAHCIYIFFYKPVVPPPGFESYEMTPGNLRDLETKKSGKSNALISRKTTLLA